MRISMLTYTIGRQLKGEPFDVEKMCKFLRELAIADIDWVSTYGHPPEEVRRITDDYGMRNVVHTFTLDAYGPADEAKDAFKRNIAATVTLGAKIVMLPPKGSGDHTREESFRLYVDRLHEVLPVADDAGVTVTVEHFANPLSPFTSSSELNRLCRDVPGLRVCFDNGNVTTAGENAGDAFRNNAQFVVHAHFKDFRRCGEGEGRPMGTDGVRRVGALLGDGEVDQVGCLQAMKDCGYDGCIDFEYEGSELSAWDATTEGVRRLRQWMSQSGIEEG